MPRMMNAKLLTVLLNITAMFQQDLNWAATIEFIERRRLLNKFDLKYLRDSPAADRWTSLRALLINSDYGFWQFLELVYCTGQIHLYNWMCPVTPALFPELDGAITPPTVQQSATMRFEFHLSSSMLVVRKEAGLAILEITKVVPGLTEFLSISVGQLMVLAEYLGAVQATETTDFTVVGRLGPLSCTQYGKRGPYNPANEQHQLALATPETYKYPTPAATQDQKHPMEVPDCLLLATEQLNGSLKVSFYSIVANLGQRLLSLTFPEYYELIKTKPMLESLMLLVPSLPNPSIVGQIPTIGEHDQRVALGVIVDKLGQYLRFLIQCMSDRDCPGCLPLTNSSVAMQFAAHHHLAYPDMVDRYIGEAAAVVYTSVGKEKLKRLVFREPMDPLTLAMVFTKFITIPFPLEMLSLLVKYQQPKKAVLTQQLVMDL